MKSLALLLIPAALLAQTNTLQVFTPTTVTAPGTSGTITIGLSTPTGVSAPAALMFTLNAPIADITAVTGVLAPTVNKSLSCNTYAPSVSSPSVGIVTCVIWGLNNATIAPGTIASFTLTVAPTTVSPGDSIALSNASASDSGGNGLAVTTAAAIFKIQSPCDLSGDGQINLTDVELLVQDALQNKPCGPSTPCTVIDVEKEILVVLNQIQCPVTGP